jgi:hypothetical protein
VSRIGVSVSSSVIMDVIVSLGVNDLDFMIIVLMSEGALNCPWFRHQHFTNISQSVSDY